MKTVVLKRYNELNYVLALITEHKFQPFVCGYAPVYDLDDTLVCWGQGHYFSDIEDAIMYMKEMEVKCCQN